MAPPEVPSEAPSEANAEPASSVQVGESSRQAACAEDRAPRLPHLHITVVAAEAERVHCVSLELPAGVTLAAAAQSSGLWHPASGRDLGVWGHRLPGNTELSDGDRVEIYRALQIDPKDARRHRAELRRTRKSQG